jgi:bifunctional non-homologous end joining protein LigD
MPLVLCLEVGHWRNESMNSEGRHAIADWNPLDALPARAKAQLRERAPPTWVSLMLATLTNERFSREGWLFEPKLDGERCLAFRDGRTLRLLSRNRKQLNEKYPEIAETFHLQQTDTFIADGEIVAFKDGVRSCFKTHHASRFSSR